MRKLMMAVMAVAAAGMVTTGCSRKSEVKRQEVAETRLDLAKAPQEKPPEVTQPQVEDPEIPAPAARDMNQYVQVDLDREQAHTEALMDLAGAPTRDLSARMNPDESSATGGSGLTKPEGEADSLHGR